MELFYSDEICGNSLILGEEEARHCIRVLRHAAGDEISAIDGKGRLYRCRIVSVSGKNAQAQIMGVTENWGGHPYTLEMAVCPTKNIDRYEWFVEKACEIGVDCIVPVSGDHSERRTVRTDRLRKILLSAAKQSLKGRVPDVSEITEVKDYIQASGSRDCLKLIAYCFEDGSCPRISVMKALENMAPECTSVCILIGPEGDFSEEEALMAIRHGFIPIHLGPSRLRTETAALCAVSAVYSHFLM